MLNLRLVQPPMLIDISALPELRQVTVDGADLVIGACVTHADIEDGCIGARIGGVLASIAAGIAYRAVRNRGTIGGSLCHADPAADWVTTLPALGATVMIRSLRGERVVPVEALLTGALTTALAAGELLVAVRVPMQPPEMRFGYAKHCRKVGDFSKASAAILVDPFAMTGRVALGALDGAPKVIGAQYVLTRGDGAAAPMSIKRGAAEDALIDAGVVDPVRRHIHATVLARAAMGMMA
jgi:carbon-monoxide dehydrogenase medium subunit